MNNRYIIGIYLGTTTCCVGVWKNGIVEIIPNDYGTRTTQSIISFTKKETLIGESAKLQMIRNSENTIYDSKLLIGRKFDDPEIQNNIKSWSFKLIKDTKSNKPLIQVNYQNEKRNFLPEEILGLLLYKIKKISNSYIGKKVTDAIITVPSYFNDSQRQSIKDSCRIAGLNILRIIDEPIAATVAYELNKYNDKERNILVFHLGGRTCNVSILKLDNDVFEVISTVYDNNLGGQDFDNQLLNYCFRELKKKTNIDISKNQNVIEKLKRGCEKAKINLSFVDETEVDINSLFINNNFIISIKRSEFEDLCKDYFNKCIKIVERTIKDSKINKEKIDYIILTGGCSRIPKIQTMLSDYFNGKELCKSINPDEVVAIGTAIQGGIINDDEDDDNLLILIDVILLSLGIEIINGKMDFIINRNKKIPIKCTKRYETIKDNQNSIKLRVYKGERLLANQNNNINIKMVNNLSDEEIDQLIEEGNKMKENDLKILKKRNNNYENSDLIDNSKENMLNLSLGIELMNGEMKKIIPRNTKLPFKNSYFYEAEVNNNNEILLKIYQGERILAIGNFLVKKMKLSFSEKLKSVKLEIIFELDENFILKVICKNINSGEIISNIEIQINNEFEEEYIEEKVENSISMEKTDKIKLKQNNLKLEIKQYALKMIEKANEALKWIENHQKESIEVYSQQLEKLKKI